MERRLKGTRLLVAGLVVLVLGVGPLLLYIPFGPADGNPIGLGLLAFVAMPVAGVLALLGLVTMVLSRLA
jgi:hypothetical protein